MWGWIDKTLLKAHGNCQKPAIKHDVTQHIHEICKSLNFCSLESKVKTGKLLDNFTVFKYIEFRHKIDPKIQI